MNCKQGDIAVIIRGVHGYHPGCDCLIGRYTKVGTRSDSLLEIGWSIEPVKCKTSELVVTSCADACMRPIPPEKDVREHDQVKELETV